MTLPSTVTTNLWPDHKNTVVGPFAGIIQVKQETSSANSDFGYDADKQEFAQSFQADATGQLASLDLYVRTAGSTIVADKLQVELYDHDAGSDHFGTLLASAQPILPAVVIGASTHDRFDAYRKIIFPAPYTVQSGTTYWLRFRRTGSLDTTNYYQLGVSNTNPYANGRLKVLSSGGWADVSPSTDARFKINIQQTSRHAFAVDKTNNKVRCYRSTDNLTWTEQDSANAPAISSTSNLKSLNTLVFDDAVSVFIVTGSTRLDIFRFSLSANTWGSSVYNTIAPTFNTNVAGVAPVLGGFRPDSYYATAPLSDYVFVNNGATETIMGNAFRRIKLSRRLVSGGTWNTPYDVVGSAQSPPDATLPGVQVHYDLRAAILDNLGTLHVFFTQSDSSEIKRRSFAANNTFGDVRLSGSPAAATSNSAAYPIGQPALFLKDSEWWIAFPYVDSGVLKVARCRTRSVNTAGAWTLTSVVTATIETTNSNPAVLVSDNDNGGKLFLFYTKTDGKLYYTHDSGSNTWVAEQEFRPGTKTVGALSAMALFDAIGLQYLDTSTTPDEVRYDQAEVFFLKDLISNGASLSQSREVSGSSYSVQSDIDETADVVVTTHVLTSTADGEVPQPQCVLESQGGGVLGEVNVNPGVEVTVQTSVSGADAIAGFTGV